MRKSNLEFTVSYPRGDSVYDGGMRKRGIIQSRGLGDIIIAMPIAWTWHQQGDEVCWPICEQFFPSVRDTAPWVRWLPIVMDNRGEFFHNEPMRRLEAEKCDEIVCLYNSLSLRPELSQAPWFQIQKFDEYKYTRAGVPFKKKWTLAECLTRQTQREHDLYQKVVRQDRYAVVHLEGSTFRAKPDLSFLDPGLQVIEISPLTDCVFDWLAVLERARAIVAVDSVFANIVDQLDLPVRKYWVPRSHIQMSPVLGSNWTILPAEEGSKAAIRLFKTS